MRQVPIGIQDFGKIRDLDLYFVDKTPLIDDILSRRGTEVFLFTRPRRFGKSTNLSMIDAYLNMEHAGNTWFDGLSIDTLRPADPEKNAYPVVKLDLKGLSTDSFESFLETFGLRMAKLYGSRPETRDQEGLSGFSLEITKAVTDLTASRGMLISSLDNLMGILESNHGRKVVALIDDYDSPVNESYDKPCQREILDFMRGFLTSALKGNRSLRLGVVTGIMQIATGGMFSGLNNLKVNNIVSTDMDEAFGFTPEEVERLCADMGHPERFEEAREWYDGYRFGESDIYNPWSVLNYVDSGSRPETYWAGTSGNTIIDDLLSIPDEGTYGNMMTLGSGRSIESDLTTGMTFADINDLGRGIHSVLAFSGYLTAAYDADSMSYRLRIPNREMYGVFSERILDRLEGTMSGRMRRLSPSLLGNDADGITSYLTDLFEHVVSGRVLDDEHSYQAFIAAC